jgi:PPOX class probable F420-dependent enzyme
MSTHSHTTIKNPTGGWSPARSTDRGRRFVLTVTLLAGLFMTAAGMAALLAPGWFADAAGFPRHTHFVHDAGAFQLGIGVTLLLAVAWRDGLALALAGFLVANTTHAVNHAVDLDLGGHSGDPWGLAALSLLTAAALVVRLGQLGWVVGEVTPAASPVLARFVRQKTVLVTTYRRDGRPVSTPVSLAVDGDHAYLRSFEKAGKTRRIGHNPRVEVAPSTARGRPTGPGIRATARRLEGAESRRAARLLARKHPLLHGVLVPLTHRLGRAKTGKTVHFQLTPLAPGQVHPNACLLEAFYQAQAAFYAGGDDTTALRGLLADDIVWHVPGRSPIAGHYHGHQEVLGYFAARPCQGDLPGATTRHPGRRRAGGPAGRRPAGARRPAADLADRGGVPHRRRQDRRVLAGALRPVPVRRTLVLSSARGGRDATIARLPIGRP